jgi:hypothetical protein
MTFIQGWRQFIVHIIMVISLTWIAIETKDTNLVVATGGIFLTLAGVTVAGKKIAGDQALKAGVNGVLK